MKVLLYRLYHFMNFITPTAPGCVCVFTLIVILPYGWSNWFESNIIPTKHLHWAMHFPLFHYTPKLLTLKCLLTRRRDSQRWGWTGGAGGGGRGGVEEEAVHAGLWRRGPEPWGVRGPRESERDCGGEGGRWDAALFIYYIIFLSLLNLRCIPYTFPHILTPCTRLLHQGGGFTRGLVNGCYWENQAYHSVATSIFCSPLQRPLLLTSRCVFI